MITNESYADLFKLYSQLLDLHQGDAFKAKNYAAASFRIDKLGLQLDEVPDAELDYVEGIGKSLASKIREIRLTGTFKDLEELAQLTPAGVVEIMKIKGLGPKKVGQIWRELGIESVGELLYACHENRLADLKGFGKKTQEAVIESIQFLKQSSGKFHYAAVVGYAAAWMELLEQLYSGYQISETGAFRRRCEIIEVIQFVTDGVPDPEDEAVMGEAFPEGTGDMQEDKYIYNHPGMPRVEIYYTHSDSFARVLFETTGTPEHLAETAYQPLDAATEEEIYTTLSLPYIIPELREGRGEAALSKTGAYQHIITDSDLKGVLHNHSTWSDGMHSLEDMALYAKEMGYQYLGICDHSRTAVYANGLSLERVMAQHEEIDRLNQKLVGFTIFKGIESDILGDGSLDYSEDVLKTFDFIVASVHQNLKMDEDRATARVLKAVENPYTTILGHPTGRLLLSRPGYPLDHRKVIDACAANGVAIEINAHPYRLDLDWRWIRYALDKNVMLSINPDAHRKEGFSDMQFGVLVARKGGLDVSHTLNALTADSLGNYFKNKQKRG